MSDKTIKQIADYLGCPKIRVYRYIKTNHISETYQNGNTLYYNETVSEQIISGLKSEEKQSETFQDVSNAVQERSETFQNTNESLHKMLLKQLEFMQSQLLEKDKQLAEKDNQIESLNVTLNAAQQTQQQLTSALTAAQALHAGTIQERLTDNSSSVEDAEEHQSFFKRLFKRKSY
mgnify:CR=1 FL=1|jgi:hypothetical protein